LNTIELALRKSYCADLDHNDCIGCLIVTRDKVVLACKRCGNETIPHNKMNVFSGEPQKDRPMSDDFFREVLRMKLEEKR
jgi:hypothetical protein